MAVVGDFLGILGNNARGSLVLLGWLVAVLLAVQWVCWTLGIGRFKPSEGGGLVAAPALRYLVTEALTKIINDFRHLLALILVVIFAAALAYSLGRAEDLDEIKEALQAVAATLGGLVGSIIGYYFGESKGRMAQAAAESRTAALAPESGQIEPARVPAQLAEGSLRE